jgi:hypothetical protein
MLATRRLGLNADIATVDLVRAVKNRLRYNDDSLAGLLQQIETALHNPQLAEAYALELARQLNQHTQNLKLISLERQENTLHADRVPGANARTN